VFLEISEAYELAVRILSESVKYRTVLGEDYEAIVDYYRTVFVNHGVHVTVHRVPDEYVKKVLYSKYNPDKPRYILFARIGRGEHILQFNGHYDVVPPGEGWSQDPFIPVVKDGRLYGRGSSDMKGGIAAILSSLIYLAQTREPEIVVEAVLVPDEEIGGLTGTGYVVNELGSRPDWVIIGEPSGVDNIYIGHRGVVWFIVKIYGKQAHGSSPWLGDNAFEKMLIYASRFIEEYRKLLSSRISKYIYEDPNATKPTINPGGVLISPGAVNIVPGVSGFSVDRRLIIEERVEDVVNEIEQLANRVSGELGMITSVEFIEKSNPAYMPEDSLLVRLLKTSVKSVLGLEPKTTICVGGLDLKYYTSVGIPAIAYGPGTVGVAHKPDEYIELEDLKKSISVYVDFIKRLEKSTKSKY
jgi:succinyl-diaminopimelate desuccinylase